MDAGGSVSALDSQMPIERCGGKPLTIMCGVSRRSDSNARRAPDRGKGRQHRRQQVGVLAG